MYESYFGLTARPFNLTPNPAYLVPLEQHREALSMLEYALGARQGLVVLTGEAGTGKTTVLRAALAKTTPDHHVVMLQNPSLTRSEFLECLALSFGLSASAAGSKARLLRELGDRLWTFRAAGQHFALVVDEAQSLGNELLEEVRLLGNFETDTEKLLPIALVGQPELRARLNRPELRQLKQRVALRCELRALTFSETCAYVSGRVRMAGSTRQLFSREALRLIHQRSTGIPRSINVICDNALIAALAGAAPMAGEAHVRDACRDLDLNGAADATAEPEGRETDPPAGMRDDAPAAAGAQRAPAVPADDPRAGEGTQENRPLFSMFAPRRRLWLFR